MSNRLLVGGSTKSRAPLSCFWMSRISAACLICPRSSSQSSFALPTEVSEDPPRAGNGGGGGGGGRRSAEVDAGATRCAWSHSLRRLTWSRCSELSGLCVTVELVAVRPIRRIMASMSIIAGDFDPALSKDGLLHLRSFGVLAFAPAGRPPCDCPDMVPGGPGTHPDDLRLLGPPACRELSRSRAKLQLVTTRSY